MSAWPLFSSDLKLYDDSDSIHAQNRNIRDPTVEDCLFWETTEIPNAGMPSFGNQPKSKMSGCDVLVNSRNPKLQDFCFGQTRDIQNYMIFFWNPVLWICESKITGFSISNV